MSLTLSQLTAPLTVDQLRTMLLGSLKGQGIVVQSGTAAGGVAIGTGTIALSGSPTAAYPKIVIKIVTAGELGTAVFQYSLDGGVTFSANQTVPASTGAYLLSTTGVTVTFQSGPVGAGTSFGLGDTFTFALIVSALAVTAWSASGSYRQFVEIDVQALALFSAQDAAITAGGFTTTATASWADLLGQNFYGLTRNAAAATAGQVTLTDAASAGPFTITAGQMTFASSSGLLYTNTTGGTLAKSGSLNLQVQAISPGSAFNVGNGTITSIVGGTLPGVTVNNPDPGSGTWVTSQGADAESDSAYMLRCQQRWPALGVAPTQSVFSLWATLAEAAAGHATTITKTLAIQDPAIPGQVDLYLAGASGAVGAQPVADVVAYLQPRLPTCQVALVQAATNVALTIAGVVNYLAAKTTLTAITAAVAAAMAAYINALGIGSDAAGVNVKAFGTELLAEVGMAGAIAGVPVVRNITGFTVNGGTDVGLTLGQVATLTNSLTFTAV